MTVRLPFIIALSLLTLLTNGCLSDPQQKPLPSGQHLLHLPGALQSLSTCRGAQSLAQLEVRTAISGGILDVRSLGLEEAKDGTLMAKADFNLDGVNKERTETLAIGVYGRVATTETWIQLATLEEAITLTPNQTNTPKLDAPFSDGCGSTYDATTGALLDTDSFATCDLIADLN